MSYKPRGRGGNRGGGTDNRGGRGGGGGHQSGSGGYQGCGISGSNYRGGSGGGHGGGGHRDFRSLTSRPQQAPGGVFDDGSGDTPEPDKTVTIAEDKRVKETQRKIIDGFPSRPGHGTLGRPIILRANFFRMMTASEDGRKPVPLHRYSVSVAGETLSKPKTRRLLEMILELSLFDGVTSATDFSAIIVTTSALKLGDRGYEGELELRDAKEPAFLPAAATDTQQVLDARKRRIKKFKIEPQGMFDLQGLVQSLQSARPDGQYAARDEVVQLLNLIMAKKPNDTTGVFTLGQNKFYPDGHATTEALSLGGCLRALRGYYSSVRPVINRILLNLNVSSAAFYKSGELIPLITEYLNNDRVPRQGNLGALENFLFRLRVETNYLKALGSDGREKTVSKTMSIKGFAKNPRFGNAREVKFSWENPITPQAAPRQISVAEYFKSQHGITLKAPGEPVLNVGSNKNPAYVPMELATVLPGQAVKRLLSGQQTAEMITFAARPPNLNAISIAGTVNQPGNGLALMGLKPTDQKNTIEPFGIRVLPRMITVHGRILNAPLLEYAGRQPAQTESLKPNYGSWNVAGRKFLTPGSFDNWACVVLNYAERGGEALRSQNLGAGPGEPMLDRDSLVGKLATDLKSYGLKMGKLGGTNELQIPPLKGDPESLQQKREKINEMLDSLFKRAEQLHLDILLIILKENDKWLYSRIKFYGDVKYGIQSVCCVGQKIQKPKGQGMYLGNLALKFNIKGGGVAHTIPANAMKPLDHQTMLVGIDITHPSPDSSDESPSIAGVVASTNKHLCQWPGSIRSQTGRKEMVEGLTAMMGERLDLWVEVNKMLPKKIIIYRDGVSEGQYRLILEQELPAIQAAFTEKYGKREFWPKLSIIVVGKRHHTRFYPTKQQDADIKSWNPQPGTVVDRGVTQHFLWDFYLQAHAGLQGTARPAHYVVILDELGFDQNQLEAFTHNMCYLFNRATKAVSICPPAYYADLVCERGRAYLYTTLHENNHVGAAAYSAAAAEWTGGVHRRLSKKTFYV